MSVLNTQTAQGNQEARLTNIKVPKEVANLLRIYCIFNNRTVTDYATSLLKRELEDFRKKLEIMKQLNA